MTVLPGIQVWAWYTDMDTFIVYIIQVLTRATQAAGKVLQALMVLAQDCVRRPLGAPTRT